MSDMNESCSKRKTYLDERCFRMGHSKLMIRIDPHATLTGPPTHLRYTPFHAPW